MRNKLLGRRANDMMNLYAQVVWQKREREVKVKAKVDEAGSLWRRQQGIKGFPSLSIHSQQQLRAVSWLETS